MAMIRATIRTGCGCLLLALSALPALANAATVSYYLNQSNQLVNGINYLKVTLTDGTASNTVDVRVDPLTPSLGITGTKFGIQKFGFNLKTDVSAGNVGISGLPGGWRSTGWGKLKMSRFGYFNVGLRGDGGSRQSPLRFTVTGLGLGDIQPYFAAQVAGFQFGGAIDETIDGSEIDSWWGGGGIDEAYFCRVSVAPVPLPAALWLMIGGLAALAGIARRRTAPA